MSQEVKVVLHSRIYFPRAAHVHGTFFFFFFTSCQTRYHRQPENFMFALSGERPLQLWSILLNFSTWVRTRLWCKSLILNQWAHLVFCGNFFFYFIGAKIVYYTTYARNVSWQAKQINALFLVAVEVVRVKRQSQRVNKWTTRTQVDKLSSI